MRSRLLLLLFLAVLLYSVPLSRGHNITQILSKHPEFSTFNHYLTATHLAGEINRRRTITVLAVDNAAMSAVLALHLTLYSLKNLLALHVLVDYFGAKKLHQITGGTALVSTVFQATGSAPGMAGFVNITDRRAGKVTFAADGAGDAPPALFVKSVLEIPYTIAVLQISSPLASPVAEAPVPSPAQLNLTTLMSKKGCKLFADLVSATGDVEKTFEENVRSGLTVFCPIDQAMKSFAPAFKNLTAAGKTSLLLFHALPVYSSLPSLKSGNGVVNTLATEGAANDFNLTVQNAGEVVTLKTRAGTAKITGTLIDEDPLAVYTIDGVLQPRELFKKKALALAPSPAPDAPASLGKGAAGVTAPTPSGPEGQPADDEKAADDNAGAEVVGDIWIVVAVGLAGVAAIF